MEPVWLRLDGGRDAAFRPGLGFLERASFAAKILGLGVGKVWISLDSLVRIGTFQWVTRDIRRNIFPDAFPAGIGVRSGFGVRKGEVGHMASLA